jgi:Uma2 family endonuclease
MTAHALMYVDKPTFYRFLVDADEQHRYEFVRGWIMQQQAGGTLRHVRVGTRFLTYISQQLDPNRWIVSSSDRAIDTGDTVRYADVVVEAPGAAPDSLATTAPVLIVEVLSPSSEERDLGQKPDEYLALPSLQGYIVAHQDEARCFVWIRKRDGSFSPEPATVEGMEAAIEVPSLAIRVVLGEIYRGVL